MKYVINIGRQFGAGGLSVANCLAQKLGIKAYDKELLNIAAKDSGLNPEAFKMMDEKRHNSFFMGLLHSILSLDDSSYNDGILSNDNLFKIESEAIKKIAASESSIFVGRCADYILREEENVFNVFLTADLQNRIERISARIGISPKEAEDLINDTDSSRAKYYNYFTFKTWGAAESYDLCINTSRYGIDATADYIIDYFRLKSL